MSSIACAHGFTYPDQCVYCMRESISVLLRVVRGQREKIAAWEPLVRSATDSLEYPAETWEEYGKRIHAYAQAIPEEQRLWEV